MELKCVLLVIAVILCARSNRTFMELKYTFRWSVVRAFMF